MNDPVAEIIDDIQHNGLRWVTVIAIIGLIRKERRNHLLNKRDEALFHNQKVILEALGVGEQWRDGPRLGFRSTDLPSFSQWLRIYWMAILQKNSNHLRRKKKMKMLLTSPWSKKLFAFLLLVIVNGLNSTLGLNLDDDTIARITNVGGVYIVSQAAVDMFKPLLLMFIGSFTKKTGVVEVVDTKITVDPGANK